MRLILLLSLLKAVAAMRPVHCAALRRAIAPTAAAITLLGGAPAAEAALRDDVVELADASYPILKQFKSRSASRHAFDACPPDGRAWCARLTGYIAGPKRSSPSSAK